MLKYCRKKFYGRLQSDYKKEGDLFYVICRYTIDNKYFEARIGYTHNNPGKYALSIHSSNISFCNNNKIFERKVRVNAFKKDLLELGLTDEVRTMFIDLFEISREKLEEYRKNN